MKFWECSAESESLACVSESGEHITYSALHQAVDKRVSALPNERSLCLIMADNTFNTLVNYLACLKSGHCAILLEYSSPVRTLEAVLENYQPNLTLQNETIVVNHASKLRLDKELAVMLTTSGSTGSVKFVCLSYRALAANTQSICAFLPIRENDKVITTLPFSYSFGLSIINTHLAKKACIVFNKLSVIAPDFWQAVNMYNINALYGVPFVFETLRRINGLNKLPPSMRYLAQAGGRLDVVIKSEIHSHCIQNNRLFYTMYGQTEATARIAYLPPEKLSQKPESIGQGIPGCTLFLTDKNGKVIARHGIEGELCIQGDNIMLGYAESLGDLADFSKITALATGDIGYQDKEGDVFVTGRIKRIIKINGERTQLDEVECLLATVYPNTKALGEDNNLICVLERDTPLDDGKKRELTQNIANILVIHARFITLRCISHIPVNTNGKTDYKRLAEWC